MKGTPLTSTAIAALLPSLRAANVAAALVQLVAQGAIIDVSEAVCDLVVVGLGARVAVSGVPDAAALAVVKTSSETLCVLESVTARIE